jgi:hypothetical protein
LLPNSDIIVRRSEVTLRAMSQHFAAQKNTETFRRVKSVTDLPSWLGAQALLPVRIC